MKLHIGNKISSRTLIISKDKVKAPSQTALKLQPYLIRKISCKLRTMSPILKEIALNTFLWTTMPEKMLRIQNRTLAFRLGSKSKINLRRLLYLK